MPGEFQQRSLVGPSPWGHRVGHDWATNTFTFLFSSVQFSRLVVSDSLRPHELQHARPPCPSPSPRVHSNSCPSSGWCHPATSSSVIPFSSCLQSLPASESFPMSQLLAWGGQSITTTQFSDVLRGAWGYYWAHQKVRCFSIGCDRKTP